MFEKRSRGKTATPALLQICVSLSDGEGYRLLGVLSDGEGYRLLGVLSDGEGYRLLGVGLIQCTLGTHGLPLSRHKINQTQTQSASK